MIPLRLPPGPPRHRRAQQTGPTIHTIRYLASVDPGRGIHFLAHHPLIRHDLFDAAHDIATTAHPAVVIVTGFYIPTAPVPAAETDGPLGAALLAAALTRVGVPVRLVTDSLCAPVVAAAARAAAASARLPVETGVSVIPVGHHAAAAMQQLAARGYEMPCRPTHLVYIERVGPAADGSYRSMRGLRLDDYVAPLERLRELQVAPARSVGIGDGGNEVGWGRLSRLFRREIEACIPHGQTVACVAATNWLIAAGTSNWGAAALTATLGAVSPSWRRPVLEVLADEQLAGDVITAMVDAGAVDGTTGRREPTVDGLAWQTYLSVPRALATALQDLAAEGPWSGLSEPISAAPMAPGQPRASTQRHPSPAGR